MERRVVITGIGVLTPIGIGREAYWDGLAKGITGFRPITVFDTSPFSVRTAGDVAGFDPEALLGKKGLRDLDRSTRLICSAAKLALDDAQLTVTEENTDAVGVAIGTTFGSLHSISQFDRTGLIEGPRFVNPSHFPNTVINSPASQVSIRFRIKGFNTTISTGFCSGLDAVSYAADFIRLGRADAVLAGAVEELCEETFLGFHTLGCLSGLDGSEPRSCPFDARRNGIILAEGAVVLVLEGEDHALRRGAAILGEIRGCGNAFDPAGEMDFSHEGRGLGNAIGIALKDAAVEAEDIDCVLSCANSTQGLDRMETKVLKAVLGRRAASVPVSAVKSMIGETYSASAGLSLAAAVGVVSRGIIPPTVNYQQQDPACDLDYVTEGSRSVPVTSVLVPAADPYGQNAAVVVGKYA